MRGVGYPVCALKKGRAPGAVRVFARGTPCPFARFLAKTSPESKAPFRIFQGAGDGTGLRQVGGGASMIERWKRGSRSLSRSEASHQGRCDRKRSEKKPSPRSRRCQCKRTFASNDYMIKRVMDKNARFLWYLKLLSGRRQCFFRDGLENAWSRWCVPRLFSI